MKIWDIMSGRKLYMPDEDTRDQREQMERSERSERSERRDPACAECPAGLVCLTEGWQKAAVYHCRSCGKQFVLFPTKDVVVEEGKHVDRKTRYLIFEYAGCPIGVTRVVAASNIGYILTGWTCTPCLDKEYQEKGSK